MQLSKGMEVDPTARGPEQPGQGYVAQSASVCKRLLWRWLSGRRIPLSSMTNITVPLPSLVGRRASSCGVIAMAPMASIAFSKVPQRWHHTPTLDIWGCTLCDPKVCLVVPWQLGREMVIDQVSGLPCRCKLKSNWFSELKGRRKKKWKQVSHFFVLFWSTLVRWWLRILIFQQISWCLGYPPCI